MKKLLFSMVLGAGLTASLTAGTSLLYENFGDNDFGTTPPQIDALAFANYGSFTVSTTLPFDFQNTINFTNKGTMSGNSGFEFDTAFSLGPRQMAGSFISPSGATVTCQDSGIFAVSFNGTGTLVSYFPSFLLVSATNVVHGGLLSVGAGGLLQVQGERLDLTRGGLEVRPIEGIGTTTDGTNFFPDIGVTDNYWGGLTNQGLVVNQLVSFPGGSSVVVQTPASLVTNAFGGTFFTSIGLTDPLRSVYTNKVNDTNWIVQAVFVGLADPAFSAAVRFANSPDPTVAFKTAAVQVSFTETNVVTGDPSIQSFYLSDTLASMTNYVMLTNFASFPTTFKPSNYDLSRLPLNDFLSGNSGNATLTTNLISNVAYSNNFVTNFYSAYAADIASVPVQLQQVPGVSLTNQPGRIEIRAKQLDLSRTRMRANTYVSVQADHLIASSNAVVDAVNLGFILSSTNGTVNVQNLVKDSVVRLGGTLRMWSGLWTNEIGVLVTNMVDDGMGGTTNEVVTNVVDIGFHVLVVDATAMQTLQPVEVIDFACRSTNVVINDNMTVVNSFLAGGTGLSVNGSLSLTSGARDWVAATAPNLLYFTNQGGFFVENDVEMGTDRPLPYQRFENSGLVVPYSFQVRAQEFDNSGTISTVADVAIDTAAGKMDGGTIFAGGNISVSGTGMKFRNSTLNPSGTLVLSMENNLEDGGIESPNSWACGRGFEILVRPKFGNLLGTEIDLSTPRFANVVSLSAAENRGATVAGFSNNAAIGRLSLTADTSGLLTFAGVGTSNALYVDFLDLVGPVLSDLEGNVAIDPNLVIYFADSNGPVEQMDGQFGGRLVWVRDFAGPNSSVDVILANGQTIKVNRALRDSLTIDSDGDGIPNGLDPSPFDNLVLAAVSVVDQPVPRTVAVSWKAAAGSVYDVQFAPDFDAIAWQTLLTYTNSAPTNRPVTILDTNAAAATQQRYYRLRLRVNE